MTEQMQNILAMWTPGPLELVVILVVAVLIFGRRLPEIARSMGKSLIEFKKGLKETKEDIEKSTDISDEKSEENSRQDNKKTD